MYTVYTTIKPPEKKSTEIYGKIIEDLSKKNVGKFIGDCSVTTKDNMRKAKKNRVTYIGRIKKNLKVEIFGKKFKIEELFKDEKLCKRTIEGKEFYPASKVVNIPEVGRVKI